MAKRPKINPKAGEALQALSLKLGFEPNTELATATELNKGTLSKIFSGETGKPKMESAQKLIKAFVEKSCQPPEQVLQQVIEIYSQPRSQYVFSDDEIDLLRKITSPTPDHQEFAKEETPSLAPTQIPPRYHKHFIGQQEPLAQLLEQLSFKHSAQLTCVEGIGGVGKTTLVLEAAHRCQQATGNHFFPRFELIIFTSAKSQQLIGTEFLPRPQPERTLRDIMRVIFRTLNASDRIPPDLEQQEWIYHSLVKQRTLLIVDNLETIEEQECVLPFLHRLPPTVKVVVTTRWRTGLPSSIHLECLSPDAGLHLIQHQVQEQKLLPLSPEQSQTIYQKTGGLPLGIVYAIGQLSVYGISVDELAATRFQGDNNLARHCFKDSVQRIKGQAAHHFLMVLSLFVGSVSRKAIADIALPNDNFTDALAQLYKLRLVMKREERFDLHSLTREYASAELRAHPEIEQPVRERWIDWYLNFSQPDQQQDWKQWQEYQALDEEWENLQAVIDWCIQYNRYEAVRKFWQQLRGYTYVHGYWHERLAWIDWLLSQAAHQDQAILAEVLWDKVWIFSLMGKPEQLAQVNALLSQISKLHVEDNPIPRFDWAHHRVIFLIHQRQFPQAAHWLNVARELLARVPIEEPEHQRLLIRVDYYQAEMWFRKREYTQAKSLFQKVVEQAQTVQWLQAEVYSQNWLADVAIEQENLDEAECLLNLSLPIAQQHKDKRSIAFHKRSWAKLERSRGNFLKSQHWATEARADFTDLGMHSEAEEMQLLRQDFEDSLRN